MKVGSQLFAPASLPPKYEPCYPLIRRLGGPQSQFGLFGKERKILSLPETEIPYFSCTANILYATSEMQTISSEY
jgi:hypothetical protein